MVKIDLNNLINVTQKSLTRFSYVERFVTIFLSIFTLKSSFFSNQELLFFEECLLHYGKVAIVKEGLNYHIYPFTFVEKNRFGKPQTIRTLVTNSKGFSKDFKEGEFCIFYNTPTHISYLTIINEYLELLTNIDVAISINIQNSKKSVSYEVETEAQKNGIERAIEQIDEGKPFVIVGKANSLHRQNATVITNDNVPFISDKLRHEREYYINEIFQLVGVDIINLKKERMLTKEVEAQANLTNFYRLAMYKSRQEGLKELKEIFPEIDFEIEFTYKPESMTENKEELKIEERNDELHG